MGRSALSAMVAATLVISGCDEDPDTGASDVLLAPSPPLLSQTGLYADIVTGTLADGVMEVQPRFPLWSDTAGKRRWLWLPPGTRIDTSNMDAWVFPIGTRAWKEFTRDGVRIETRLLEKVGPGPFDSQWSMVAYTWNDTLTEAQATPSGFFDLKGTDHDVPASELCFECHSFAGDALLGIGAIQLSRSGAPETLASLDGRGLLSDSPTTTFDLPGSADDQAALGYLHANCGNCHNERNPLSPLHLWLNTTSLSAVTDTPAYQTTVNRPSRVQQPLAGTTASVVIAPGDPNGSLLFIRMGRRGPQPGGGMPFVGSEIVDPTGLSTLRTWIESL